MNFFFRIELYTISNGIGKSSFNKSTFNWFFWTMWTDDNSNILPWIWSIFTFCLICFFLNDFINFINNKLHFLFIFFAMKMCDIFTFTTFRNARFIYTYLIFWNELIWNFNNLLSWSIILIELQIYNIRKVFIKI